MRVAALAPLAALLVTLANAAPVPVADPLSFCFFGFGNGCDNTPTTSVAAVKTTSSSSSIKATSTSSIAKITSSSAVSSVKSSSVSSAAKAAATTQSVPNWTWLWDPTYVFNMWNNFLTFRWEKYNDCNFNGYSLTYVKAYYYNTYGFKPLTGCQWKDVYTFMDKYAVKNSVKAPSNAVYTPGCANPFSGADSNWKPSTVTSSSVKVSSSSAAPSPAAASSASSSKASSSSVASSSVAASSSKASSSVPSSAQSSAAQSPAAQSSAAQSPAAQSSAAQSSVAQSSAAQTPAAQSSAAQSSAAQSPAASSPAASSPAAQSSAVQSAAAQSSAAQSSVDQSSVVQSSAAQSPAPSATDSNSSSGVGSASGTSTASAAAVTSTSYGTPVTFSNGQTAQYLGCVQEFVSGRKLSKASIDVPALMTNEYCSSYCSSLGFPVSGTEYAKECYCGTYDQIATYDVSDQCVMPCSGDSTLQSICGGPNALTIHVLDSVPVRTVSFPPNWAAQGCFQDNNDRVLPYQAWSGNSATTVESCSAQCASSGYSIAGVEYGTECYCGNSFVGGAVEIDSSNCNFVCPGNMQGEMCGGSWSLSVASSLSAF
ncbi:hypothetical protein QFC22_004898 [Naganishia vaughanmartiniae]|uniref:Uncharacterized protein n=1 Tax=Naganishia vaughanmartiniae TaxID=1424756 RepID=A0ACC2X068_9TREE|nr:hypothetical protein QFC22_004898 [Naganishia vaughanmartiniae]